MEEDRQTRRVTIRLTPYQARRLWKLRIADLPEGARPRTVTEVLVRALLDASRATDRDDVVHHPEPVATAARREENLAVHDERPLTDAVPAIATTETNGVLMASETEEARHH